jgi:hypothetical protein
MPLILGRIDGNQNNGVCESSKPDLASFPRQSVRTLATSSTSEKSASGASAPEKDQFSIRHSSAQSIFQCFRLLSDLSSYSQELFADLSNLIQISNHRFLTIKQRLDDLQSNHPNFEQAILQKRNTDEGLQNTNNASVPTYQSQPYKFTVSLVDRTQLRLSFVRSFVQLKPSPAFHLLKPYRANMKKKITQNGVGNIGESYSNPQFFLKEWVRAQEKRLAAVEAEKKQKKADRKKREKKKDRVQEVRRKSDIQAVKWQDRLV